LNRVDEIIVFRQLTKDEVKQIADILLKEVFDRMTEKKIRLTVSDRFKDLVVEEGYNPSYGARPLRRAIQRLLEDILAEEILTGHVREGSEVLIDVDEERKPKVLVTEPERVLLPQGAE
ncbi:ATP-dependent Clp protease ATP-binding subunit ClpC, partial [Synechococcus sp. R6-7]